MADIILTPDLIHAGKSDRGGWNRAQLESIGIQWKELRTSGWIERNAGRIVTEEAYRTFIALTGKISQRTQQIREKKAKAKSRPKPYKPLKPAPQPLQVTSYKEYLETEWWKYKRCQKLISTEWKCERCNGEATQVHHKHYQSLGREKNKHLESICADCHTREHECKATAEKHLAAINRTVSVTAPASTSNGQAIL